MSAASLRAAIFATAVAATLAAPARADEPTIIRIEPSTSPPAFTYDQPRRPIVHVPMRTVLGAEITDWQAGDPIPDGYRVQRRPQTGLVIAGAVTFGTLYFTSALAGGILTDAGGHGGPSLFVPVFGPFAMAAMQHSATGGFFLVLDGLAQGAGIAMLAVGLARPAAKLVRFDIGKVEITPTPMAFGPNGGGLGFVGRF